MCGKCEISRSKHAGIVVEWLFVKVVTVARQVDKV